MNFKKTFLKKDLQSHRLNSLTNDKQHKKNDNEIFNNQNQIQGKTDQKRSDLQIKQRPSLKWNQLVKLKKARIIIRNLPFGITEEELKQEFGKFGDIYEIQIAKNPEGRMKGYGFLNFQKTLSAIQAIKNMNGKTLSCGRFQRVIAVDYAMPKKMYEEHVYAIKSDENNLQEKKNLEINDGPKEESDNSDVKEDINNSETDSDIENDHIDEFNEERKTDLKDKDKKLVKEQLQDTKTLSKIPRESNDVDSGRTLFIRNLSFDSSEDDLRKLMNQFGELDYCLLCIDKLTEHPKGTAFVKFKCKESADQCLQSYQNIEENEDKFYLDGRVLQLQLAISKAKLEEKEQELKKLRDKRNLYLLREGLIYPDSPAAKDVSPDDLEKRMLFAQKKKAQMENLHYFVAKNRLCIYNLPYDYTDDQLRKLVEGVFGNDKEAKILSCHVIRSKNKATNELKESRGFGYVTLSTHLHSLRVLRNLNNNPNVFTKEHRPIVEFSVENLNAIKKNKQKILKECQERGLENELVSYPWAGIQAKPFGESDRVRTPFASRKLKEKSKQISVKRSELKRTKREKKEQQMRKKFMKQKISNRKDNKMLKNKRKHKEGDSIDKLEQQFLKKARTHTDESNSSKNNRKQIQATKTLKWFE